MADNASYTPGVGGSVATDNIGGVDYQRVKITVGDDGVAADVSPLNALPVKHVYGPWESEVLMELKMIRRALIALACDGGRNRPEDFTDD